MKRKILIHIFVLILLLAPSVYAQEATSTPDVVISDPEFVIPAEAGIQDQNTPMEESVATTTEDIATSTKETATTTPNVVTPDPEFVIPAEAGIQDQNTPVEEIIATTTTPTAHVLIRNGADLLFDKKVEIGGEDIVIIDTDSVEHSISASSTLGILMKADGLSDAFEVSDIQYYESFGALYLKCITVGGEKLCENWQYVINGSSPWSSIEQTFVEDGDSVGFYFGSQYQVLFDAEIYATTTPIIATAQTYEYQTDTWSPRTDVTIGVTTPDPLDPWTPIVLATYPVDENGEASFTIATSGVYQIGIAEDYYYPTYAIEISTSTGFSTTTATSTDNTGGSTGGGSVKEKTFDIASAISFLKTLQKSDGSYGDERQSDWVAIAFSAYEENDSRLLNYLKSKATIKNVTTDNERRAMALLALGKDPYNFEGVNYIEAIIKDFDGTQFGETNLINDDIFALIVLSKVGYESDDIEVQKTIEFILKKQSSWGDLTGAAIQALSSFSDISGVSSAISKAEGDLKNSQKADGGWKDVYTSAWAAMAMYDLGENWTQNGKDVQDYFSTLQDLDGGVLQKDTESESDRIWATREVIPAALGKSWNDILKSVSRPKTEDVLGGGSGVDTTSTSTATTTIEINEDITNEVTEEVSTSTIPLAVNTYFAPTELKTKAAVYENSKKDTEENTSPEFQEQFVENISDQQLAAVGQVSWLKDWWVWVFGGVLIFGGVFGLRKLF